MHTVIIGAGEVGLNTARMLSHEGHNVVLVVGGPKKAMDRSPLVQPDG